MALHFAVERTILIVKMDIREIVDSVARSRRYKRQRKNHYFRLNGDVYHLLDLDKGTWSRTYQLNFCISLDFSPVPKSPLTRATIEESGAPCDETRGPAEEALSFDSELDDDEARERLLSYFKCVDDWMFGLGNSGAIRTWVKSHGEFYIEGSYVRRGVYEFLELPIPTKSRQEQ